MFFILSHSRPKGKGRRASFSLRPGRTYQPLPSRGAAAIPKRSRAFYAAKKILRSAQDDMFSPPVILGSTALLRVILGSTALPRVILRSVSDEGSFPHPAGAIRKKILRSAQDDMFSPPVILGSTALPRVILKRHSPSPCHPEERQRRRIFPPPNRVRSGRRSFAPLRMTCSLLLSS